jgi:hypothetical protein
VNMWALSDGSFALIEKYASLWKLYREAVARR